jgi:hypothetical protein
LNFWPAAFPLILNLLKKETLFSLMLTHSRLADWDLLFTEKLEIIIYPEAQGIFS